MMAALALQPHVDRTTAPPGWDHLTSRLLLIWWLYLYLFAVIPAVLRTPTKTTYEHAINVLYLTEKMVFLAGLAVFGVEAKVRGEQFTRIGSALAWFTPSVPTWRIGGLNDTPTIPAAL